jgi:hypothetical protein
LRLTTTNWIHTLKMATFHNVISSLSHFSHTKPHKALHTKTIVTHQFNIHSGTFTQHDLKLHIFYFSEVYVKTYSGYFACKIKWSKVMCIIGLFKTMLQTSK